MKILNLFAGIGGNRTLWGEEHEIVAVESNQQILDIYISRFPNDEYVLGDALTVLRQHGEEFDFIWASPSCTTHTSMNVLTKGKYGTLPEIPDDRSLYGLIRWLQIWFKGKWVVENVKDYMGFLIPPTSNLDRHYFWSNFTIPEKSFPREGNIAKEDFASLARFHKINENIIPFYKWDRNHDFRWTVLRNCVDYRIGKYILDCAQNKIPTMDTFLGGP